MTIQFFVIDNQTGREPDMEEIALREKWADGLIYCDMQGFAVGGDGTLYLLDECGAHRECPEGRFRVVWADGGKQKGHEVLDAT